MEYLNKISVDEVNCIRKAVGFRQDNQEQLQASINGSALIVAAYDHGIAVGFSRLIWDNGGQSIIEDVMVTPKYHNKGIEKNMIDKLLQYLREQLKPGYGIQVDVRSWPNQKYMYTSLGFKESTIEQRGQPMQLCLTDQIELTDQEFRQCGYEKVVSNE